jgi:hypothetical protein
MEWLAALCQAADPGSLLNPGKLLPEPGSSKEG